MTLTITHVATGATHSSEKSIWGVLLTSETGEEHTVRLPHEQGDPAPTWQDVRDHLATLPEEHALAGARLAYPLTQRQYLLRLTDAELYGIVEASEGRGDWPKQARILARRAVEMTRNGRDVDIASPLTRRLVRSLERAGLLGEGRANEILDVDAPSEKASE